MTAAAHTPTGVYPDLDGSGGQGPLLIQSSGDVLSYDLTFKSATANRGVLAKLIDACDVLRKIGPILAGTNRYLVTSRSLTKYQPILGSASNGGAADWQYNAIEAQALTTTANTNPWLCPLILPDNQVLTAVAIEYLGAGGHAALPATMPTLKIRKFKFSTATTSQLGATATDGSASTAAFQARHFITVSSLSETVENSDAIYWAEVAGEAGANFVANGRFTGIRRTLTVTSLTEF